jgi:hypothetical protein
MTRETVIERVKKKYANADVATIDAVLKTLQESGSLLNVPQQSLSVAHSKTPQAAQTSRHQQTFVGENLSPEVYRKLSFEERGALNSQLKEQNLEWLKEKFTALQAAWLTVMNGVVIASGKNLDTYPRIEQVHEIISRYGKQPIIFVNDSFVAIEENGASWNTTVYPDDFYPTVSVALLSDLGSVEITADFDTGAVSSFVDYDLLVSHHVIELYENENIVSSKHLGEPFIYFTRAITVETKMQNGDVLRRELPIQCVANWFNSPFIRINPHRTALIGRDAFLNLRPIVHLDFDAHQTTIDYRAQT